MSCVPFSDPEVYDTAGTTSTSDDASYGYLYDTNGNVGQLVDFADGSLAAKYEYDPYGGTLLDAANASVSGPYAATNLFRFSTKYFDAEVNYAGTDNDGLYYYGYRYYSPRLGRWLSRDPLYAFRYDALGRRVETIQYVDEATGQRLVDDGDPPAPAPRRIRHVYAGLPGTRGGGKRSEPVARESLDHQGQRLGAGPVVLQGSLLLPRLMQRLVQLETHQFDRPPRPRRWDAAATTSLRCRARWAAAAGRIADEKTLASRVKAWESERNQKPKRINWQFTTSGARIRLRRPYPQTET